MVAVQRSAVIFGIILPVRATVICSAPAFADRDVRVCIGEDQANGCPVAHNAMYRCNTTIVDAAKAVCTVYNRNGTQTVSPFRFVHQGSHEGGHCGYEWYVVTCVGQ
jgi:hypothetical protein